jgi:hypothetical protein
LAAALGDDPNFATTVSGQIGTAQSTADTALANANAALAKDPTLTLAGDASGSATFTNLGNATLTVTVADDSHNHTIANVDGLQAALDGKVDDSQVLTNVPAGAVFTDTVYTHPTYNGDDFSVDTGPLTGATVVSDIDINVTTDSLGHVTDANGVVSTRTLTLGDLGYTGATDANKYVHPTYAGDDINLDTGPLSGATVISDLDFNVTTDTQGHVTDANATYSTRNLTYSDVGAAAASHSHSYLPLSGGTMTGNIMMNDEYIDFKTSGNPALPQIRGYRGTTDLNTRLLESEGGLAWTTYDSGTNNKPSGTTNNANGVLSLNTHGGSYGHQLAFTNSGGFWHRSEEAGSVRSWDRVFTDTYHPNADKWTTARTLSLTGDVTGSVSWDGSANASITTTVANDSHNHSNYVEKTSAQALHATDALRLSSNTLSLYKGDGSSESVDLSLYLDDTNLARLVSGSLNGSTGVATFTRDDSSSFTIDFSPLFDDTNLSRITSAGFNTADGVLTLTRNDSSTVTVDLDGRYANASHSHSYLPLSGGTLTGTVGVQGISNSIKVGDITADNYTEIKHTNADGYGFDFQHNNASVVLNQQGTTNEVVVLGDVDAGNTNTLFGVGHSTDGGANWTPKFNFRGDAELYIGSSAQNKVFHDGYHPNADKWTTARTLTLNGDVSGSVSIDGSANKTLTVTVADDSHNHTIANVDGLQAALDGKQAAGTYNTIIGTDSDINTSGATIIDNLYMTDGVITSHGTRTLTLSDLGFTGETNATADQTITAGSGLSGGGTGNVTLSHADTSSQGSVNNSGTTFIQDITLDTYGHITGIGSATVNVPEAFPSGTAMLFQQTSAPTGWTKSTAHNDKALRVVSGTASSGGSSAFSTALGTPTVTGSVGLSGNLGAGNLSVSMSGNISNTTLSVNTIPSHSHSEQGVGFTSPAGSANSMNGYYGGYGRQIGRNTGSKGNNGAHGHSHNLSGTLNGSPSVGNLAGSLSSATASINVQYVDIIIATKD